MGILLPCPGHALIGRFRFGIAMGAVWGMAASNALENLPVEVKRSVEGLKGLQVKQDELVGLYKKECLELEKKVSSRLSLFILF